MPNFKRYIQNQPMLLPLDIRELIDKNSIVYLIDRIVESLDLSRIYDKYSNDEGGSSAYHPSMLIKILFYAYVEGIRSSRKIAHRVGCDIFFMYLAGFQKPDFRTISDFRKNNIEELKYLFTQIAAICYKYGLVNLGHVAIDGTKICASAGRRSTYGKEKIDEMIKGIEAVIERLLEDGKEVDEEEDRIFGSNKTGYEIPDELKDKEAIKEKLKQIKKIMQEKKLKQVNLTDSDSRFMKEADGSKDLSYNVQVAVDAENQIIVGNDVTSEPTDQHQFIPMYEQVVENLGDKPKEVSADCGYDSNENYVYIKVMHICLIR